MKFRFEVVGPNGVSDYRSVSIKVLNAFSSKDAAERVGQTLEKLLVIQDTDPVGFYLPQE